MSALIHFIRMEHIRASFECNVESIRINLEWFEYNLNVPFHRHGHSNHSLFFVKEERRWLFTSRREPLLWLPKVDKSSLVTNMSHLRTSANMWSSAGCLVGCRNQRGSKHPKCSVSFASKPPPWSGGSALRPPADLTSLTGFSVGWKTRVFRTAKPQRPTVFQSIIWEGWTEVHNVFWSSLVLILVRSYWVKTFAIRPSQQNPLTELLNAAVCLTFLVYNEVVKCLNAVRLGSDAQRWCL